MQRISNFQNLSVFCLPHCLRTRPVALQCSLQKYHTLKVICGNSSLGLSVLMQQLFKVVSKYYGKTSINRHPLFAYHTYINSRVLDLSGCKVTHVISKYVQFISFIFELQTKEDRVSLEKSSDSKFFVRI